MYSFSVIDWLVTTALVAASWQLYQLNQPEPRPAEKAGSLHPMLASLSGNSPESVAALETALRDIQAANGFTDLDGFLRGARRAYEAIVTAFVAGDLAPVDGLLGPAVHKSFDDAITERVSHGETLTMTFVGFLAAEPVAAGLEDGAAWIDVRFVTQQVSAATDSEGRVVAGHPRRVDDLAEIWTFKRQVASPDPNWMLVATEADE